MDLKSKYQKKENMTTRLRIRPSKKGERPKSRLLCDYVHYTVLVLHHQYLSYLMTKKCTQFLSSIANTCPVSKQKMRIVLVLHHQFCPMKGQKIHTILVLQHQCLSYLRIKFFECSAIPMEFELTLWRKQKLMSTISLLHIIHNKSVFIYIDVILGRTFIQTLRETM
jgi:hypothetical protein